MKYISLAEAARIRREGESSLRNRAAAGMIPGAIKPNRNWIIPWRYAYGFGRAPEEEQAEYWPISTDGERDIVLAVDGDDRRGVYIDDEWHSAAEALEILNYLQKHQRWLYDGRESNRKKECEVLNIANIPVDQRPSDEAWAALKEIVNRGEATLDYKDGVYIVRDDNGVIPLKHLEYSSELGLYDKRQFLSQGK